ncbi:hypothetical protein QTP86_021919 [Hemibagrus guttatus]|nr:hypothetical protein QTP86_021919 [Hemibagrus guttatus]
MELHKFLLVIIIGVFSSTLVIVFLFIIINMCIRRKAAKYAATSNNHTKSSFEMGSTYKQNGQEDIRPPLPPRDQFDTESMTNSYEEMPEIPVVAVENSSLQSHENNHSPQTQINFVDNLSASESYDDVDELQKVRGSYEEVASLPDYLDVDPPPFPNGSDESENYDDVDQLQSDTEDYDDVV